MPHLNNAAWLKSRMQVKFLEIVSLPNFRIQRRPRLAFGRASGAASRAAPGEALPNVCFVTGFTREAGPEAIGGLHRQGKDMKSWFHAAYTSI